MTKRNQRQVVNDRRAKKEGLKVYVYTKAE